MQTQSKSFKAVDLVKFVAALFVVAIHTRPFIQNTDLHYYFTAFCRWCVPFFFITTSYFFFRKPNNDIKKYSKRILLLYLMWFIILSPITIYSKFLDNDFSFLFNLAYFFDKLIFNSTFGASWFLMACFLAMNIVYYLSKRLNNKQLILMGGGIYLLSLLWGAYYGLIENTKFGNYYWYFGYTVFPCNSFIAAVIFIVLGKILAEKDLKQINFKTNLLCLILFTAIYILEVILVKKICNLQDAMISLPFVAYFLLSVLLKTNININDKISTYFRKSSILIYILHCAFLFINKKILGFEENISLYLITVLQCLILSYIIIALSNKFKALKYLY